MGAKLMAPLAGARLADVSALTGAAILGVAAYATVVLLFHRALLRGARSP
jgi:hypothetical protein